MRLNLYWRGWDLFDIEVHALRRRPDDETTVTRVTLEDCERAEPMDPDTIAFGFQRSYEDD